MTENCYVLSKNEQRLGKAELSLLLLRRQLPKTLSPLIYKKG